MKGKKKRIAVVAGIIALVVLSAVEVIHLSQQIQNEETSEQTVVVSCWNDNRSRYAICKVNEEDEVNVNASPYYFTGIKTEMTLEEMAEQNPDYIGDMTYIDPPYGLYDAKLFFDNNNYYVMYKADEEDSYCARCCCGDWYFKDVDLVIPLPVSLSISENLIIMYTDEVQTNLLDYLFDNYSFAEASEYYGRYSDDVAEIDEVNQRIFISGYSYIDKEIVNHCICIDFKNRKFIYDDGESDIVETDGIEIKVIERE